MQHVYILKVFGAPISLLLLTQDAPSPDSMSFHWLSPKLETLPPHLHLVVSLVSSKFQQNPYLLQEVFPELLL